MLPRHRRADCRMLRELRRIPSVTHECRKCRNALHFAIARMMAAILMAPTSLPFTSAQVLVDNFDDHLHSKNIECLSSALEEEREPKGWLQCLFRLHSRWTVHQCKLVMHAWLFS